MGVGPYAYGLAACVPDDVEPDTCATVVASPGYLC